MTSNTCTMRNVISFLTGLAGIVAIATASSTVDGRTNAIGFAAI